MDKNKIALQLYSVRDDAKEDLYGVLKKVKAFGYSGVEFIHGLWGHDPLEVKAMCEEIGLVPLSAHVPYLVLMEDLEAKIDYYVKLGVQYVSIPFLNAELRYGTEGFEPFLKNLVTIGKALRDKGIVMQYHNHDFEFQKTPEGEYILDLMYRVVGPEYLQTQIDTCWVNVGGENPADYLKKYAGRTPTVHLKDFAGCRSENMYALIGIDDGKKKDASGEFEFRPVGKGLQNFPQIIAAADECGAEWYIVEQDQPSMGLTPMECAEESVKYLLSL